MKPARVTMTTAAVVAALLVVFFLPLPVSRVRETGLVQVNPMYVAQRHVDVPGQLKKLHVKEGQWVKKDQLLAEFFSLELENTRLRAAAELDVKQKLVQDLNRQLSEETDPDRKAHLQERRSQAEAALAQAKSKLDQANQEAERLVLRAPRDGVVIGLPQRDEIDKTWIFGHESAGKDDSTLFCAVGDRTHLRIIVPVSPADLQILRDDLEDPRGQKFLPVTIRIVGRGMQLYTGKITYLPPSEAKTILPALSSKAGGPVAVKPSEDPNHLVPQSQVFLVDVDLEDPDSAIALNSLAQVHIHCRYRSIAWWVWRTVSSTFDLRLL